MNFLKKQILDLKNNPYLIFSKLVTFFNLLLRIIFFPANLLFVVFIISVQRFILIRLGFCKTKWIGEWVVHTEIYLYLNKDKSNKRIDIFIKDKYISNRYVFNKYKNKINYFPNLFNDALKIIYFLSLKYKYLEKHLIKNFDKLEKNYYQSKIDSKLELSKNEIKKGYEILNKNLKQKTYKGIVLFTIRNEFYNNNLYPRTNWSHYQYRNYDFQEFLQSVKFLTSKGYLVLRMGNANPSKIKFDHDLFIDYSFVDWKSDFMDVFLGRECSFCISTGTGSDVFARIFKKPLGIITNPVNDIYCTNSNRTHLFGCVKNKITNKYLTLDEIFTSDMSSFEGMQKIIKSNFVLDKNDSNDILNLTREVQMKFENKFFPKESDELLLQEKFWSIFFKYNKKLCNDPKSNFIICSKFLKDKKYLLKL